MEERKSEVKAAKGKERDQSKVTKAGRKRGVGGGDVEKGEKRSAGEWQGKIK